MKKLKKDFIGVANIEGLRKDAIFNRIIKGAPAAARYWVTHYCRSSKKFVACAENDHCKEIFIKKGTKVNVICNY